MIFWQYIAANYFKATGIVLLLLLALFSFLSLAEALDDVGKGRFGAADAISVVILTTPARIIDLLPVTALLGSIIGLGTMANHRELMAMRAAGLSARRIGGCLAVIAVLMSAGAVIVQQLVIPVAERHAQDFRSRTLAQTARGGTEFWSRRGERVIRVGEMDYGRVPRAIEIYELNREGRLERLLTADRADVVSATQWLLRAVDEKVLAEETVRYRHLDTLQWASFLSPEQMSTLISPAHALSANALCQYLSASADSGVDTREQEILLWHQISLPLSLVAMILLGLPLVLGAVRTRSAGFRSTIGAAIGIGFYLFEQITGHLALLLDLEPALTAMGPPAVILGGALLAIRRSA